MTVYAVYAHSPRSPRWELQEVCHSPDAAESFADTVVQSPFAEAAVYDVGAAEAIEWDESIVVPYSDRAGVVDLLPDDHAVAYSARFTRAGYTEVT
ncbi:MAG: hypothetical protein ACR2NO_07565 [Chloroflexota bacterium]